MAKTFASCPIHGRHNGRPSKTCTVKVLKENRWKCSECGEKVVKGQILRKGDNDYTHAGCGGQVIWDGDPCGEPLILMGDDGPIV